MDWLPHQLYVLCLAALLDIALGDPPSRWHPVAWMGTAISTFRRHAPTHGRALAFLAGVLFMLVGIAFCATAGVVIERLLWGGLGSSPIATETQGQIPRMNSGRQEGGKPGESQVVAWSPNTGPTAGLPHYTTGVIIFSPVLPFPGFLHSCLPDLSWESLNLPVLAMDARLDHAADDSNSPGHLPPMIAILLEALLLKLAFSVRGLAQAGRAVRLALERNDLTNARELVATHLVSRDTRSLTESQLAAATIESLAENTSDSIVAPLLYYALAGLPGVWVYRFINTCDAMLGYRDAEREWLGKAAARLDDLVNLIPSRLTAGLMLLVGFVQGQATRQAVRVWWRDCRATASPNAGHPMSAAAGLLGVELEKVGHYQLGRGQRLPGASDIHRATRLMWGTWLAALAMTFVIVLALK